MNIVVLVDFENDSVRTALEVARALGPRLWGVRLDTSGQLVDRSLWGELGDFDPRGVNERLVRKVRDALDADGFERVRIVASGGFTVDKIEDVRAKRRPGRRLRGRLLADPRPERLHGRHRDDRRPARRRRSAATTGRTRGSSSSARPRAPRRPRRATRASASSERTRCAPDSAKRAKAASASSV